MAARRNYRALSFEAGLAAFAEARRQNVAALRAVAEPAWSLTGTQEGVVLRHPQPHVSARPSSQTGDRSVDAIDGGEVMSKNPTYPAAAIPYLMIRGAADALDFYKRAFAAAETMRFPMPNGL